MNKCSNKLKSMISNAGEKQSSLPPAIFGTPQNINKTIKTGNPKLQTLVCLCEFLGYELRATDKEGNCIIFAPSDFE